jgi:formamidopyrimidine-DNA glycosylase
MPELPEVENLRRGLERAILRQKISHVEVKKPKLVSGKGNVRSPSHAKKSEFEKELRGERFVGVERRAKNLIFRLSHGKVVLVHLKMSGQFVYKPFSHKPSVIGGHPIELSEHQLPNKHTHIIFELERGTLYYNDTRMFGYLLYYPGIKSFEAENHFGLYGLEPLDRGFTAKYLENALKNKKGKIKTVLMEQKIVTGLGNIYVDESLFEARIRPDRSAATLARAETERLHKAIVRILRRAVKVGGSSVATYRLLDETRGNYAREHKVYGKAGKKCVRCGTILEKTLIQNRTTIFCPNCQK